MGSTPGHEELSPFLDTWTLDMTTHLQSLKKHAPELYSVCEQAAKHGSRVDVFRKTLLMFQDLGQGYGGSLLMGMAAGALAWGGQTFEVPSEVSDLLVKTDLTGVTSEEIQLPYPVFFIATPDLDLDIYGADGKSLVTVKGIYVTAVDQDNETHFVVCLWGGSEKNNGDLEDASTWIRIVLKEGQDVEDRMEEILTDHRNAVIEVDTDDQQAVLDVQTNALLHGCRLALNLALYLSSDNPDLTRKEPAGTGKLRQKLAKTKNPQKRARYQKMLDKQEAQVVTVVGASLAASVRELARTSGGSLNKAHWVRGHYRTYWTGAGRKTRLRKWVKPFPRGFEQEPEPGQRNYRVGSGIEL